MLTVNAEYLNPVTDVYHLLLVYVQSFYQTTKPASPAVIKTWHFKKFIYFQKMRYVFIIVAYQQRREPSLPRQMRGALPPYKPTAVVRRSSISANTLYCKAVCTLIFLKQLS
jgi:hypothetical protein